MRTCDLELGSRTVLELVREDGAAFEGGPFRKEEVELMSPAGLAAPLLLLGGRPVGVVGASTAHQHAVEAVLDRNRPRLCWIVDSTPRQGAAERLMVQVHEFSSSATLEELLIRVDDGCLDDARRLLSMGANAAQMIEKLADELFLPESQGLRRALLSASPSGVDTERGGFRIHGNGLVGRVREVCGELVLQGLSRARASRGPSDHRPVHLIRGQLRFVDVTVETQLRGLARTQLDEIVAQADSYLTLWSNYNQVERERLLHKARRIGWLRYQRFEQLEDGRLCFHLDSESEDIVEAMRSIDLEDSLELEASESLPPLLLESEARVEASGTDGEESERPQRSGTRGRSFIGKLTRLESRRAFVRPLDEELLPPREGVLFPSLMGHQVRLSRRENAVAAIRSADCKLPLLGVLLEGRPLLVRPRRRLEPLTPTVKRLFPNGLTQRQLEALTLALNTPDIMLIQGPPGTGKTQVLSALSARLGELGEGEHSVAGEMLITSYQHDAVENAANRTRVFGLPPVKIGKRNRGRAAVLDGVERWRQEHKDALEAHLQSLPEQPTSARLKKIRDLAAAYQRAGDIPSTIRLLQEVTELAGPELPKEMRERLLNKRQELARGPASSGPSGELRDKALRTVRGLAVEQVPFSDDGPQRARRLLVRLAEAAFPLGPENTALLQRAGDWPPDQPAPDELLAALSALRDRLVEQLLPEERPVVAPTTDPDVEQLLAEVVDMLHRRVLASKAGVEAVLAEYLHDLTHDPEGVREALREYTLVLAATCQQSDGREMRDAKDGHTFENVIVDEAARSNPLDLFIPMAKACRRIILVGDHRQLPHLLEPEVERELGQSVNESTRRALRESLFQRLFEHLREQEKRDRIRRTITLDTQFRMHEVLGDFVSRSFYERHGEPRIKAGRPATDFVHGLARYLKRDKGQEVESVAAWLEVPATRGHESGRQSKRRLIEARVIAQELKELLALDNDLSFGVIALYKAQETAILEEMRRIGIAEDDEQGQLQVARPYRELRGGRGERLRVGTVDAFQGKEFDVVLLSLVRSNEVRVDAEPDSEAYHRQVRARYGFLCLENRLCVAMSRQRRLLVVVGDPGLAEGEAAARELPALKAFRELTRGDHGIRL